MLGLRTLTNPPWQYHLFSGLFMLVYVAIYEVTALDVIKWFGIYENKLIGLILEICIIKPVIMDPW